MPGATALIDTVASPEIGLLRPILDTGGPYYAGSWTFDTFTTAGAGFLPAGTYPVYRTFGVLVQVNGSIPAGWGYSKGLDSGMALGFEGDWYYNRFCQVVPFRELLSGVLWPLEVNDIHRAADIVRWPFRLVGSSRIGLHVSPGIEIDLYYLCIA